MNEKPQFNTEKHSIFVLGLTLDLFLRWGMYGHASLSRFGFHSTYESFDITDPLIQR